MKKIFLFKIFSYTFMIIITLISINCSNPKEQDNSPPNVTITFPTDGSTVSEIITITCVSTDNEAVQHVELWVDGVATALTDNTEPYSFEWNTLSYSDGDHTVTVRSFDKSNNKTDSDPITLKIDNSKSYPTKPTLIIRYHGNSFYFFWSKCPDYDFYNYLLFKSSDSSGIFNLVYETYNNTDTSYIESGINSNTHTYYKLVTKDGAGFETSSSITIGSSFQKIVFVSYRDNRYGIYLMDIHGENQIPLFESTNQLDLPKYSSDGTKIVFHGEINNKEEVYLIDILNNTIKNLTNNISYRDYSPQFSPDDNYIFFQSDRDGNFEIYYMEIDGSNLTNLTNNINNDYFSCFHPIISKLAFSSIINSHSDIFTMNMNGTELVNLTNSPDFDDAPYDFSPDGEKITFNSDRDGNYEIYIMDTNGNNQRRLTNNLDIDRKPQFTPNGTKIIFETIFGDHDGIHMIDTTGSNHIILSETFMDRNANISLNGSKIVFQSSRDNNSEIYIMDITGDNQSNLTNNIVTDISPQFEPIN